MVALRTLQPLARQVPRLASTARAPLVARRFLTSDAPVLYSAHAKVVGARTGHVEGDDLNIDLTMVQNYPEKKHLGLLHRAAQSLNLRMPFLTKLLHVRSLLLTSVTRPNLSVVKVPRARATLKSCSQQVTELAFKPQ